MRSEAELNQIALGAAQATAKVFLGDNAVGAINAAVVNDPQLEGFFAAIGNFFKKIPSKIKTTVQKVQPIQKLKNFMTGTGGQMVDTLLTNLQLPPEGMPVPPLDVNSSAFTTWATNTADTSGQLSFLERALVEEKIKMLQTSAGQQLPPTTQFYPMQQVPVPIQQAMAQEKMTSDEANKILMIAAPVLVALALLGRK